MADSVRVIGGDRVYVLVTDRRMFDAIPIPVLDHREHARAQPLLTKSMGDDCRVYFIHHIEEAHPA